MPPLTTLERELEKGGERELHIFGENRVLQERWWHFRGPVL